MNLDNERKAFEAECKLLKYNGDMTMHHVGNFYIDQTTNWMYQMWLSSKNREGYKLVPVEPKFETMQEMNVAIIENISETPKYRMQQVYKAMIGACDDH